MEIELPTTENGLSDFHSHFTQGGLTYPRSCPIVSNRRARVLIRWFPDHFRSESQDPCPIPNGRYSGCTQLYCNQGDISNGNNKVYPPARPDPGTSRGRRREHSRRHHHSRFS